MEEDGWVAQGFELEADGWVAQGFEPSTLNSC